MPSNRASGISASRLMRWAWPAAKARGSAAGSATPSPGRRTERSIGLGAGGLAGARARWGGAAGADGGWAWPKQRFRWRIGSRAPKGSPPAAAAAPAKGESARSPGGPDSKPPSPPRFRPACAPAAKVPLLQWGQHPQAPGPRQTAGIKPKPCRFSMRLHAATGLGREAPGELLGQAAGGEGCQAPSGRLAPIPKGPAWERPLAGGTVGKPL